MSDEGAGIVMFDPPWDPNMWLACKYPERPWDVGMSFHLRESDSCRPCAIAWMVARLGCVADEVTDELTRRAEQRQPGSRVLGCLLRSRRSAHAPPLPPACVPSLPHTTWTTWGRGPVYPAPASNLVYRWAQRLGRVLA